MDSRSYTHLDGTVLSFWGFDVGYEGDHCCATWNLRFGTSPPRMMRPTSGVLNGMRCLKRAYVSWTPLDTLLVDFGQFDTSHGAEVSESWMKHNYSRGTLYNLAQFSFHNGFCVVYSRTDEYTDTGLAVNA